MHCDLKTRELGSSFWSNILCSKPIFYNRSLTKNYKHTVIWILLTNECKKNVFTNSEKKETVYTQPINREPLYFGL